MPWQGHSRPCQEPLHSVLILQPEQLLLELLRLLLEEGWGILLLLQLALLLPVLQRNMLCSR